MSWESWLLRDLATRSVMALGSRWAPPSGSGITSSTIWSSTRSFAGDFQSGGSIGNLSGIVPQDGGAALG